MKIEVYLRGSDGTFHEAIRLPTDVFPKVILWHGTPYLHGGSAFYYEAVTWYTVPEVRSKLKAKARS